MPPGPSTSGEALAGSRRTANGPSLRHQPRGSNRWSSFRSGAHARLIHEHRSDTLLLYTAHDNADSATVMGIMTIRWTFVVYFSVFILGIGLAWYSCMDPKTLIMDRVLHFLLSQA